jgi:mannose-6-phosphate isomerase-like protein (cupin superfamily)
MVVHRKDMRVEDKEKLRNGEGTAHFTYLCDAANETNVRMLAEIVLQPGGSIGYHEHTGETEYYVILSGSGTVNDNGTERGVSAGDAIITGHGASHGIKNTGGEPLVFHAFIVTY